METEHPSLKHQAGSACFRCWSRLPSPLTPFPPCPAPYILGGLIEGTTALLILSRRAGFLCNPGPVGTMLPVFFFSFFFLERWWGARERARLKESMEAGQKEGSRACRLARLAGQNSCEKGSADFPTPAGAAVAKAPLDRGHPRVLIYTQPTSSFRVHLFSTQRRGDANFTVNLLKPGKAPPPGPRRLLSRQGSRTKTKCEKKKGGGRETETA